MRDRDVMLNEENDRVEEPMAYDDDGSPDQEGEEPDDMEGYEDQPVTDTAQFAGEPRNG